MAHVDYDKKKFVRDGYGRLYPRTKVSLKRTGDRTKTQRLQAAMKSPCLSYYVERMR